jgi:acetyl esterase/lipase
VSVVVGDRVLAGPHGDLRVRVYEPAADVARVSGLVWAHGGAFMHGDLDMPEADWVARSLAAVGVVVVSVDYRLAPVFDYRDPAVPAAPGGARFPVASEEVTFAWVWARDAGLGVGPERWSLGGASAGGNLAAGASLRLRDAGGPRPRSVVLAYPVAHYELPAPSPELAAKIAALPPDRDFPPEAMRAMGANYLGGDDLGGELGDGGLGDLPISPYAHPGGQDLRGLPPTFVLTSDHDALRSSGEAYCAELAAAGVDVLLVREDSTYHGHLNEPDTAGAARSIARLAAWLTVDGLVGTSHEAPNDSSTTPPPAELAGTRVPASGTGEDRTETEAAAR